jgi:hypothetical protein
MGLKGYSLWILGQLDTTCRAPPRGDKGEEEDAAPAPATGDFCGGDLSAAAAAAAAASRAAASRDAISARRSASDNIERRTAGPSAPAQIASTDATVRGSSGDTPARHAM